MKSKVAQKAIVIRQIRRAVASSTAIETGKPIETLEAALRNRSGKFKHLKLAG